MQWVRCGGGAVTVSWGQGWQWWQQLRRDQPKIAAGALLFHECSRARSSYKFNMKYLARGGDAAGVALVTAALSGLASFGPSLLGALGLPPEAAQAAIQFLNAHSTMIPALLTSSPFASALPWGLMTLGTYLASNTAFPGHDALAKAVGLAATATSRRGTPATLGNMLYNHIGLTGLSALFRVDETAALVGLASASWVGYLSRFFLSFLIKGAFTKGIVAFLPTLLASFFATFVAMAAGSSMAKPGTPASRHGLNLHTLLHAGAVSLVTAFLGGYVGMGTGAGAGSLLVPLAAVATHSTMGRLLGGTAAAA